MSRAIRTIWARLLSALAPPYPAAALVVFEIRAVTAESERRLRLVLEQLEQLEARRERTDP